jgi:hypothetical protein
MMNPISPIYLAITLVLLLLLAGAAVAARKTTLALLSIILGILAAVGYMMLEAAGKQ